MSLEKNNFYNIDCLKGLDLLDDNSIDLVLTSPPYNIVRPNSTDRGYDLYKDGMSNEDYSKWLCDIINKLDKKLKKDKVILLNLSYGTENSECMNLTIADIIRNTNFTIGDIIVWKKQTATPNNVSHNKRTRICEFIYVLCRKEEYKTYFMNKKVVSYRKTGQAVFENKYNFFVAKNNDGHCDLNKATFSTEMAENLISDYSLKGDLILDVFMGTGTTALASKNLERNFIGFEISEKQVQFSLERIKKFKKQLSIFDL